MAFTPPPLPSGPGIRCYSGVIPAFIGGSTWLRDPSLTFDGNVRVRLVPGSQPLSACLVSDVGPLHLNGCIVTCEADGGVLLCSNSNVRASLIITPTSATADFDVEFATSTNAINVLRCQGTAPYP